jgi:hypothetical protein
MRTVALLLEVAGETIAVRFSDSDRAREWEDTFAGDAGRGVVRVLTQSDALLALRRDI